ncbi:MAG: class I SAM-dependent methyltransferase [Pseudomonadota bacterium]
MNTAINPWQLKAAATYNAAADHFDAGPLGFWDRHGRKAVELADLQPGDRVLDFGCGTGASALPAAHAVGPSGEVIGIDIAEAMLDRARHKAAAEGLENTSFRLVDMTEPGDLGGPFDAIIGVFAIFFTPAMERQIGLLWRMLKPGGRLVITVWAERSFQPAAVIFGEEVRRDRPDIPPATRPWERLTVPTNLSRLFLDGGAAEPEICTVRDVQPLASVEDWWTIAMGSGFRWEIGLLADEERTNVKRRVLARLEADGVSAIEASAHHAVATKLVG